MNYTKALEKDGTIWPLSEFIVLHGKFSVVKEHLTGAICGRFNNKGNWTQIHIEKKIRNIPILEILSDLDIYEVIVVIDEYCLYKRGTIIDYSTIWEDSNSHDSSCENLDLFEFFNNDE